MKKVNVLMFPGTNCEVETRRALQQAGFQSEVLRWNTEPEKILASDGVVIAGGFSFEDRGRSGMIAAKDKVTKLLQEMANDGRLILGICNGAQILVEMGLVPGFCSGRVEISLARNRRQKDGHILGSGYYHEFVYIKANNSGPFTNFSGNIYLPIAHGEGRFMMSDKDFMTIQKNAQDSLLYCDQNGEVIDNFPINPNGSRGNLAAISNPAGNVMAMMPHPERIAAGQKIFKSMYEYLDQPKKKKIGPEAGCQAKVSQEIKARKKYDIEFYIALKITDTEEKSIEKLAQNLWSKPSLRLNKFQFWGIVADQENQSLLAKKLLMSDEFYNPNKELVWVRLDDQFYKMTDAGLEPSDSPLGSNTIFAREIDDILGEEKTEQIEKHLGSHYPIASAVTWSISEKTSDEEILSSNIFGNPISWAIEK